MIIHSSLYGSVVIEDWYKLKIDFETKIAKSDYSPRLRENIIINTDFWFISQ